jgi:hypothetical protein
MLYLEEARALRVKKNDYEKGVSQRPQKSSSTNLIVPQNNSASCGMRPIRDRKVWRGSSFVFTPPIEIEPPVISLSRKIDCTSELFPAPVRPTTPTFIPDLAVKLTPWRISGKS